MDNRSVPPAARVIKHEQRRYERYSVIIDGRCSLSKDLDFACQIHDLCIGGMFIALTDPATGGYITPGSRLTVHCTLQDDHLPPQMISLMARVVRNDVMNYGLALIDPDPAQLYRLVQFAKAHPARHSDVPEDLSVVPGQILGRVPAGNVASVLPECRQWVLDTLPPLLDDFLKVSVDEIFSAVESIRDHTQQNHYFSAVTTINEQSNGFRDRFIDALSQSLSRAPDHGDVTESLDLGIASELTLMADEVVEDWLAATDIICHIEMKNKERLYALEQRLSVIYGASVHAENNPFGPLIFSDAFQVAIKSWCLAKSVYQICYSVFKRLLTPVARQVYKGLNQRLIDAGILPDLQYRLQHGVTSSVPSNLAQVAALDGPESQRSESAEAGHDLSADEPPLQGDPGYREHSRYGGGSGHGLPSRAGASRAHYARDMQESVVASNPGPVEDPVTPSIYQVVDDLERLRHELIQQAGGHTDSGLTAMSATMPSRQLVEERYAARVDSVSDRGGCDSCEGYSVDELLAAMDAIQPSDQGQPGEILPRIDAYLQRQFGGARVYPQRERRIMAFSDKIFSALLRDRQVSGQVKSWIKGLEIPLMKLALKDDSLFMDRTHLARKIVNNVSRLELYGDDEEGMEGNVIRRKIDRLIARVGECRSDDDAGILTRALHELESLIEIQDDAYAANISDVVKGCRQEQGVLDDDPLDPDHRLALLAVSQEGCHGDEGNASGDDLDEWLERVHRLKVNAWLLVTGTWKQPRRLKLAWVTRLLDRYVFVNLRGQRELVMTDCQLAQCLRNETAFVLDNADEPALDRAQNDMLQQLHLQLLHETTHDPVTHLLNRREFEKALSAAMSYEDVERNLNVLCYIDVLQFSVINESCGSDVGDRLLQDVAARLRTVYGQQATIARLGNDDFAVLMETGIEAANAAMQHLQADLNLETFTHEDRRYPLALSIGLVPLNTGFAHPAAVLHAGEDACRKAREVADNVMVTDGIKDDPDMAESLMWLGRVNESIQTQSVSLRCQPIVTIRGLAAGSVHHSEILLAVQDESGKLVSPQDFVLAAERFHRMPALDRLIVRETFMWICQHPELLHLTGKLAINLSGKSLNDESFLDFLLTEIQMTAVPVEQLCFEVTETAGINCLSHAAAFIEKVKAVGCSFALDDFGSGMSSYGYLKSLPVDYLKIDGSFVKEMDKNPEDFAIVKSVTEIAHFMGKEVIAEYVENATILDMLRDVGVDYAQGYHVGKPYLLSGLADEARARVV